MSNSAINSTRPLAESVTGETKISLAWRSTDRPSMARRMLTLWPALSGDSDDTGKVPMKRTRLTSTTVSTGSLGTALSPTRSATLVTTPLMGERRWRRS